MAETKGITVKVDADLHEKVKTEQEALAVTLSNTNPHKKTSEPPATKSIGERFYGCFFDVF